LVNFWWDWVVFGFFGFAFAALALLSLDPLQHRLTSPEPPSYYGLLTEAFRLGQLHVPVEIDPKLLALENPYAGPQGATRPHDMSFYDGKLYLYYGPAPVVLLYLPWRLITGEFLAESAGSMILLSIGFAAAAFWITRVKRIHFPSLSPAWLALALATLLTSGPILEALANKTFYGVPIHGGFACLMVALVATTEALRTSRLVVQLCWLAFASTAWGMAVASRPIYVLSLLGLGVAALWLARQATGDRRSATRRILSAAVLPAALIGLALMTYNYLRFDSPIDFGIRFSLATEDLREKRLVGTEFIAKNIDLYLFRSGQYFRYAPFFFTAEQAVGVLKYLPILWLLVALPVTWCLRPFRQRGWVLGPAVALFASVATLSILCLFFGGEARYLLDFTPPALLAALAVMLAAAHALSRRSRTHWATAGRMGLFLLAGFGSLHGISAGLMALPDSPARSRVLMFLNQPIAWWEQRGEPVHGPLVLNVQFPAGRSGHTEPLVVTGGLGGNGDLVTVTYGENNTLRFGYFHLGVGGPTSLPVTIDPTRTYHLEIHAGGLQPPLNHPLFATWAPELISRLRRQLLIKLDDQTVLRGNAHSYPSTPGLVRIGRNNLAADVTVPRFTGKILQSSRLGVTPPLVPAWGQGDGQIELTVMLPARPTVGGTPLVATGRPGEGDLILAEVLPGPQVRFGHDSWGTGLAWTDAVAFDPTQPQKIHVELGSLYTPSNRAPGETIPGRWLVALNGQIIFARPRPFHTPVAHEIELGYNAVGSSAAMPGFIGTLLDVRRVPPLTDTLNATDTWGALRLTVRFPANHTGRSEPLLVTGSPGRADIIYVQYGDGQVRFGHDHWGVGAALGDWTPLDFAQPHIIEIDSASLHPEPVLENQVPAPRRPTVAYLNGREVLRSPYLAYPGKPTEVEIGANTIGATSAAMEFNGEIRAQERAQSRPTPNAAP
jgi:hypothetical protein